MSRSQATLALDGISAVGLPTCQLCGHTNTCTECTGPVSRASGMVHVDKMFVLQLCMASGPS